MMESSYEMPDFGLPYLQGKFGGKDSYLEDLYKRYEQRAQVGTFSTYLIVQAMLSVAYGAIIALTCRSSEDCSALQVPEQLPDVVGHSIILAICVVLLLFVRDEKIFKTKPWLLYLFSGIIAASVEIIDVSLVAYHSVKDPSDPFTPVTTTTAPPNETSTMPARRVILKGQHASPSFFSEFSPLSSSPMEEGFTKAASLGLMEPVTTRVPVLSLYNVLVIYLFLPIARREVALAMGLACTLVCMLLFIVIESVSGMDEPGDFVKQLLADLVFFLSLNAFGYYLRYVGEINMRRSFLDKQGCIVETFKLKEEKEQEENLLLSIIPKHIAYQVRKSIWTHLEEQTPFKDLFIEKHEDVSILFADICNFTPLTTTLTAEKLVETLNDLFGKFDEAAELRRCMRIKILGDCYYCVSGVPTPDPMHAHNCVEMGLDMIDLIKDVKSEHEVDVDMRIGVHTGYILSGIIGIMKWQYDIWSHDVTIANHMESTGTAGAVHITARTKSFLGNSYKCFKLPKKDDPVLTRYNIQTYLIYPNNKSEDDNRKNAPESLIFRQKSPGGVTSSSGSTPGTALIPRRGSTVGSVATQLAAIKRVTSATERKPRQSFYIKKDDASADEETFDEDESVENSGKRSGRMYHHLKKFMRRMDNADEFLREEIERLPLKKYEQWLHPDEINPMFLLFRDKSWEGPYVREHDPLFKFYVLASFGILVSMGSILLLTEKHPHLPLWFVYTTLFVILVLLLPCLWVSYIWDQIIDKYHEMDSIEEPSSALLRVFYRMAKKINTSLWARTSIFSILAALVVVGAVLDLTTASCLAENPKNYTYRCALAIMAIFVFLRIHHFLKIFANLLSLTLFGLVILGQIEHSNGKNVFKLDYFGYDEAFSAQSKNLSHFLYLAVCSFFFFLMDRQIEYMHRLDFQWKRQLKSEKQVVKGTKFVNKMLLHNILPHHVAEVYLKNRRKTGRLYSESYKSAAVMFASIPDFVHFYTESEINQGGVSCLKMLNEIIATFDNLLWSPQFNRVEKIKVIGSTYMAACGLNPGRKGSKDANAEEVADNDGEVAALNARIMTKFAAGMINDLECVDFRKFTTKEIPKFQLRIGLNVGPVIAGVIGAQKPLYDIWGNTVNVASRMDGNGVPGKIQVTEGTAEILHSTNISCSFRDKIDVKGKGMMPVYFVNLDKDNVPIEIRQNVVDEDVNRERQVNKMKKLAQALRTQRQMSMTAQPEQDFSPMPTPSSTSASSSASFSEDSQLRFKFDTAHKDNGDVENEEGDLDHISLRDEPNVEVKVRRQGGPTRPKDIISTMSREFTVTTVDGGGEVGESSVRSTSDHRNKVLILDRFDIHWNEKRTNGANDSVAHPEATVGKEEPLLKDNDGSVRTTKNFLEYASVDLAIDNETPEDVSRADESTTDESEEEIIEQVLEYDVLGNVVAETVTERRLSCGMNAPHHQQKLDQLGQDDSLTRVESKAEAFVDRRKGSRPSTVTTTLPDDSSNDYNGPFDPPSGFNSRNPSPVSKQYVSVSDWVEAQARPSLYYRKKTSLASGYSLASSTRINDRGAQKKKKVFSRSIALVVPDRPIDGPIKASRRTRSASSNEIGIQSSRGDGDSLVRSRSVFSRPSGRFSSTGFHVQAWDKCTSSTIVQHGTEQSAEEDTERSEILWLDNTDMNMNSSGSGENCTNSVETGAVRINLRRQNIADSRNALDIATINEDKESSKATWDRPGLSGIDDLNLGSSGEETGEVRSQVSEVSKQLQKGAALSLAYSSGSFGSTLTSNGRTESAMTSMRSSTYSYLQEFMRQQEAFGSLGSLTGLEREDDIDDALSHSSDSLAGLGREEDYIGPSAQAAVKDSASSLSKKTSSETCLQNSRSVSGDTTDESASVKGRKDVLHELERSAESQEHRVIESLSEGSRSLDLNDNREEGEHDAIQMNDDHLTPWLNEANDREAGAPDVSDKNETSTAEESRRGSVTTDLLQPLPFSKRLSAQTDNPRSSEVMNTEAKNKETKVSPRDNEVGGALERDGEIAREGSVSIIISFDNDGDEAASWQDSVYGSAAGSFRRISEDAVDERAERKGQEKNAANEPVQEQDEEVVGPEVTYKKDSGYGSQGLIKDLQGSSERAMANQGFLREISEGGSGSGRNLRDYYVQYPASPEGLQEETQGEESEDTSNAQ